MAFDLAAVQAALRQDGLDGWLLFDFHGSNPIARSVAGIDGRHMTTRRWYYLVPAAGDPRKLVHAIEPETLDHLPGAVRRYAGHEALARELDALLAGMRTVAMEYSPGNAIPYVSRVDAGTVEAVRQRGVEVRSSGDLVQRFEARWSPGALDSHLTASAALHRVKDRAFEAIRERVARGAAATEYEIQQLMAGWMRDEGLVSSDLPVVAAAEHAGNPHYQPLPEHARPIRAGELVLVDLWGKLDRPGAVYADITWVAFTGPEPPPAQVRAFEAVAAARDAALALVQDAARGGRDLRGWEVDRAARAVLVDRGYGDHVLHRTGHSLGEEVHGNGVHMDDYETHDDRRLLPGTGFTLEPGLYFPDFGVRSEINVHVDRDDARPSGPLQERIVTLS